MTKVYCFNSYYSHLADLFKEALPDVPIINFNLGTTGFADAEEEREFSENAEVVVGDPLFCAKYLFRCRKLKWFHSFRAGVDDVLKNVDRPKGPAPFMMTRRLTGSKFSAEFVLCYMLAIERKLFQLYDEQKNKGWLKNEIAHCRTLDTLSVGLLGVGTIGEEVAKACKGRGMKVIGLVRSLDTAKYRSPDVDIYLTHDRLPELLEESDYICCLLPSTQETRNLLSGDVLAHCHRKRGVLINIGRGDVIDEESVVKAIRNKWIGGAVLDVFAEEPLRADSPLWSLPGVYITPHVSGWANQPHFREEMVNEFVSKVMLYKSGKPLPHIIDWEKGY